MFSVKKNVLETVVLFKAFGIQQIVISPGSRNAPLIQTFSADSYFKCHLIVDERNAAFYALGIIQRLQEPVAVCCTSGSALVNFAPAASEAFYQRLPLIILSADRTAEWIGQMDGQTIPQYGAFGALVKKAAQLPEGKDESELWYCNRLINEALITCTADRKGPVHINIPLAEPLFDYSQTELPKVRKINYFAPQKQANTEYYLQKWKVNKRKMIVVGQMNHCPNLISVLEKLVEKTGCIVIAECLSNCNSSHFISNGDALLCCLSDDKNDFKPDLVISLGGHIVSKRLKHFLRQNKPNEHWLISETPNVEDVFQSLTELIETDEVLFFESLQNLVDKESDKSFQESWMNLSRQILEPDTNSYSDIYAVGKFVKRLPKNSHLHVANSSSIRNVQLFDLDNSIRVYCNRGTNGIESTMPSTIGFSAVHEGITYLIIGDLSFFYGLNALWNIEHIKNLRILLINNNGGGIFHMLPKLNESSSLDKYVAAEHQATAEKWASAAGLKYLSSSNTEEFELVLNSFMDESIEQSIVLEVQTDMQINKQVFQEYYNKIKKYGNN